ncbi:MAG: MliC family protein [Pantoea sp.]|nr:MliC family protein [Pantoea sp.]
MKQGLIFAAALLLSGCGLMHKQAEAPQTLHYRCGTLPLTVTLDNASDQVSFIMDGQPLTLKRAISASGARYSDGKYVFWSKGDTAFARYRQPAPRIYARRAASQGSAGPAAGAV